jgi:hypothetical protein
MKNRHYLGAIAIFALLWIAAGCGATTEPPPTPIPPTEAAPTADIKDEVADQLREAIATSLATAPGAVEFLYLERVTWPDACLGLAPQEQACAEVETPGYGGMIELDDLQYEFRAPEDVSRVRLIPGAALKARQMAAQQLSYDLDAVHIVATTPTMWYDACLGVPAEDEACAEVATPGYRVVLNVAGDRYIYHTDRTGEEIRLAESPESAVTDAAITWTSEGEETCITATFGRDRLVFGTCGGPGVPSPYAVDQRAATYRHFVATYAPFEAETPAGQVTFNGTGETDAPPAVQRRVAEWARMALLEAQEGRSGAGYGLALTWERVGGIAGFCDRMTILLSGDVLTSPCTAQEEAEPVEQHWLDAEQAKQLYTYVDYFRTFELEQSDDAVADAMTTTLFFAGNGEVPPSDANQQTIANFAAEIYADVTADE